VDLFLVLLPTPDKKRITAMPKREEHETPATDPGVINWNPPPKRDVVERALSDGMTDPAKIVEWAKNYKVTMTVEEVLRIKAELKK
jgi:hypothetical protein